MSASMFSRLYRRIMSRALEPLEFSCKEGVFWRERDGIIHIIALDRSPFDGKFTVGVAVQPLIYPFEHFMLSLGSRLDRFGQVIPHRWEVPSTKLEMERVLELFADTVVKFAIPWLDRFQSAQDIVEAEKKNAWGVWPVERSSAEQAAALCALDAGMFDQGKKLLTNVYEKYCKNIEDTYQNLYPNGRKNGGKCIGSY